MERAQARVAKAQAAVSKATGRLAKARLAEARESLKVTRGDLRRVERSANMTMAQAQKAYRAMSKQLGRAPKGVDVKKHPIIFKRSVSGRAGGLGAAAKRKATGVRGAGIAKTKVREKRTVSSEPAAASQRERERSIRTLSDFVKDDKAARAAGEPAQPGIEYVSSLEYKGKHGILQVQIHVMLPGARIGSSYSRDFLDLVAMAGIKGDALPAGVRVRALQWRTNANGQYSKEETRKSKIAEVQGHFARVPFAGA